MTFECCKKCVVNGCCSCQSDNNYASCSDVFQELIKKIDELEKKLDIAVKAIDFFINPVSLTAFKGSDAILKEFRTGAKKVLKQIKGVK